MPGRVTAWALARRSLVLTIAAVLVLGSMVAALRLEIDLSSKRFFGNGDPAVRELADFQDVFGPDDNVLVVVLEGEDLLGSAALEYQLDVAGALVQDPDVARVRSLPGFELPILNVTVADLLDDPPTTTQRASLLSSPAVPALLSEDASAAAIVVELEQSTDDVWATMPIVARIDESVAGIEPPAGVEVGFAGIPAIRGTFFDVVMADQMRLVPLTILIIGLGIGLTFRRLDALVAAGVGAGLPVLWVVGILALAGEPIGLLNQTYFTLLPVIAIADIVHVLSRFEQIQRDDKGESRAEKLIETMDHVGKACLLTSLTTAAAFVSLLFTQAPVLRSFGLFAALGVMLSYLAVLTVVPVALSFFGGQPQGAQPNRPLLRRIASVSVGAPWLAVFTFGLLSAGALWLVPEVEIDNRLSELVNEEHPVHHATQVIDRELAGSLSLELALDEATPDQRSALGALGRELADDPRVRVVLPLEQRGEAVRLSVRTSDMGGQAFIAFADDVQAHAEQRGLSLSVTGTALLAYRGVNDIARQLRKSLLVMLIVVAAAILIALPNRRLTLAASAVNVIPLLWGYAGLAVLGITLDPLAAVILTLGLGIAVDDTLHMAARYAEFEAEGLDHEHALAETLAGTGRALVLTSVMLAAGLAINVFASFPALQVLGSLGALVILAALAADLLLLPALHTLTLRVSEWNRNRKHSQSRG